MATVAYTLRLDETDKKSAEQIFSQLGLTLSAGLNVYIKAVARQRKIPFELSLNENSEIEERLLEEYIQRNQKYIEQGAEDLKNGRYYTLKADDLAGLKEAMAKAGKDD